MEGKALLRYFLLSGNRSFCKSIKKHLNVFRPEVSIVEATNFQYLQDHVTNRDIVLMDEDAIFQEDALNNSAIISLLFSRRIHVLLFSDYKRLLPISILDRPEIFRVVSKAAKRVEFGFHIHTLEYNLNNEVSGLKRLQERYLEVIIQIQMQLLGDSGTLDKLTSILELVGKVTDVQQVTIFQNQSDYNQKTLMSPSQEWTAEGFASLLSNPLFSLMPYQPNFERWAQKLSSGEHVYGQIDDFPRGERPILASHGIKEALLMPIKIKGAFWGFVMFSIYSKPKLWKQHEIDLLSSVITPISSFFEIKMEEYRRDKSDERFRKIFESSGVGLVHATLEGNLISVNPAFSKMTGYDESELHNLNFKVFTHPDDIDNHVNELQDLIDGKTPSFFVEKRYLRKGGATIWVKLNVSPYSREKGKPESLVGIVENITREREAEKALQESEDRYRMLSDLSLEGIVIHQDGIFQDCNEQFLQVSGYTRDELKGKNLMELLIGSESIEIVMDKIRQNDNLPCEAIGKAKHGKTMMLELEHREVDIDGRTMMVTALRDVSVRKKNEQEIKKLSTAIEQSPSSIVITDHFGKIEYVNKSFCEITGYSEEESKGKNPRFLKSTYHSKNYYKQLWDTISSGNTWNGIFRNKTKTGVYYWERAVISPIVNDKGHISHYLAIKENITNEKKALESLEVSEERHRIIAELTNDFAYSASISDQNLTFDWNSGSLERLAGYTTSEINSMENGWYSLIIKEDFSDKVVSAIDTLAKVKVLELEYRILTKDNEIKWISDNVKLIESTVNQTRVIGAIRNITIRKNAIIELDQNKRYLDSIIDNLPIGLHIFDEKGYTTRINEAQRTLLGVKNDQVGVGVFNILSDPLAKTTGSDINYRTVYETKKTLNHEIEINFDVKENKWDTRKGIRTLNEIIFPILKENGEVHSVISVLNDITNRVEAESALKASELHQKTLLKIIPDLIFVFDNNGLFKDVYTEELDKLLHPPDSFIGKPFSSLFPKKLSHRFYKNLKAAVETQEVQSFNYELEVEGRMHYYETRLLISRENEVMAIIRDISDNVASELALKESEEKFRELAERTQDAFVLLNVANEVLYVSPNVNKIFNISPEAYINNPFLALKMVHSEDKPWVIPQINSYRKGKQEFLDMQFRVHVGSGEPKWVWYRVNTVFDNKKRPVRYAVVITDITSNKISELELIKAKEQAELGNRSKSAFLANISHEIRTPMNAVLGFSDLLYSRIQDPVLKGYLNSIKSSGNTLLNLLNDILDLSKIEADRMSIIPSPVNLFSIFEEIKHIFTLKVLEKGIDYTFEIDKRIPKSLLLDELRLKQILLNLVDNAVKFTEEGIIKVIVKRIDKDNRSDRADISIIVEDTGIGIPKELQVSIFDSFRQQDDKDKKKYKGTGLGLAITKRLVELFKGELKLYSLPHKGSKFEVILKDIVASESSINEGLVFQEKIQFEAAALEDRLIVIIDERKSNRDLIKEVFALSKCKVVEGENLSQTMTDQNLEVDLIIMELSDKGRVLSDLEAIRLNQSMVNATKIGIVSNMDFKPLFAPHFKTILTKPIHLPDLVDIVGNHFHVLNASEKPNDDDTNDSDLLAIDKEKLGVVVRLLEGEFYATWQSTLLTSSFKEVEKFAHDMKLLGVEYQLKVLQSFSDVLVMHSKNFDIDNMNDVLKTYPSIINELKIRL